MAYVFFVYGLAFFVLGFGALLYPKRQSRVKLAKQILATHHGTISATSEPGKGTTFQIKLPMERAYQSVEKHPNNARWHAHARMGMSVTPTTGLRHRQADPIAVFSTGSYPLAR